MTKEINCQSLSTPCYTRSSLGPIYILQNFSKIILNILLTYTVQYSSRWLHEFRLTFVLSLIVLLVQFHALVPIYEFKYFEKDKLLKYSKLFKCRQTVLWTVRFLTLRPFLETAFYLTAIKPVVLAHSHLSVAQLILFNVQYCILYCIFSRKGQHPHFSQCHTDFEKNGWTTYP